METKSEIELNDTRTPQNNGEVETIAAPVRSSIIGMIKAFLNFLTVEPFLFCYVLPTVFSALAVQKLNMEKACRSDLNYTELICSLVVSGEQNNMTTDALSGSRHMVAEMTVWQTPIQKGIPAIVMLFVGAWSDATGNRKSLMLVPIFGELLSAIGLIFATYYFLEWPLWATALIEALPSAFCGGISIALMGSYSYIADITTVESRTFRMGCVAVIVTLSIPLSSALSGVLIEAVGYYGVFGITAALYAYGFIHTCLRVHDVKRIPMEGTFLQKIMNFFNPLNAWDTISLLFISPKKQLIQIWLIVWAHIVVIGPVYGESMVLYLYTLEKFGMSPIDFSLFTTYSILIGIIGTSIAVGIFSKRLKFHDSIIGVIASTSKVIASCFYGLAPNKTWLYVAPVTDFFGNSGSIAVRSLGSKVVEPDQVGKMCSLIGLVEAIAPVVYVPLYSKVYNLTTDIVPGAFYLLGALMTIPAICIFIYLYIVHRRQVKDTVKDPDSKAKYAHDNDVTVL